MAEAKKPRSGHGNRTSKTGSPRRKLLKIAFWSCLAGLLIMAVLAGYEIKTWPDVADLARHNPGTTAFMELYKARQAREGRSPRVQWRWVPYARISPNLKAALLVSEDINFFSHHGFDRTEMEDSISEAWKKRDFPRGASTLTQQLAKNLWLSPSRNPWRKVKEALLTVQLEKDLGKKRILELYLNVVEFGPGIYGAEAASRAYFARSSADLTDTEAAELVAGLPSPDRWHPGTGSRAARKRVAIILRRMRRARFVWKLI